MIIFLLRGFYFRFGLAERLKTQKLRKYDCYGR